MLMVYIIIIYPTAEDNGCGEGKAHADPLLDIRGGLCAPFFCAVLEQAFRVANIQRSLDGLWTTSLLSMWRSVKYEEGYGQNDETPRAATRGLEQY